MIKELPLFLWPSDVVRKEEEVHVSTLFSHVNSPLPILETRPPLAGSERKSGRRSGDILA